MKGKIEHNIYIIIQQFSYIHVRWKDLTYNSVLCLLFSKKVEKWCLCFCYSLSSFGIVTFLFLSVYLHIISCLNLGLGFVHCCFRKDLISTYKTCFFLVNSFPCILCGTCLKETCTLQEQMLQDPRRLYAPGRLYHVIVRKPFGLVAPSVHVQVSFSFLRMLGDLFVQFK